MEDDEIQKKQPEFELMEKKKSQIPLLTQLFISIHLFVVVFLLNLLL